MRLDISVWWLLIVDSYILYLRTGDWACIALFLIISINNLTASSSLIQFLGILPETCHICNDLLLSFPLHRAKVP